ncbi:MAG: glycosyl transferase family protein [Microgenomates group bacterium Gr01-1014_7]|nr:MAG: glycosyl transferase family protein [Microgenomates group bacterium Gr01-1014_7]
MKVLFLILSIALFLRVWFLDIFPPSMIYDELNYVMNAKSLYHTGKNIPLTASALFSWGEKDFDVVISEIPSYVIMFWVGPNPLSQFNSRIIYAIFGVLSVLLVYLITKNLLNEKIANFAALFMAVNPWSIHTSRNALETTFASFFFLLGTYLLLSKNSWRILFSFPFFILGFLSYLGAKLFFLPLIIILLVYKFKTDKSKQSKLPYLAMGLLTFLTFSLYTLTIHHQPAGARTGELLIFDQSWASDIVNLERRQAIPNFALPIFINKLTITLRRVIDVYLGAFDTTALFARGETVSVYSTWDYGQFHYLDFPLIIIGLITLFTLKRGVFWLTMSIIALAPSVSAIDKVEKTYAIRAFSMFPYMVILSGVGMWSLTQIGKFKKLIFIFLISLYIVGVLYFIHLYFFRYPIYSADRWFLGERIIANYVKQSQDIASIQKIYVVTNESSKVVFEQYLFYSGMYETKQDILKANQKIKAKDFSLNKATFSSDCPKGVDFTKGEILITDARNKCNREENGKKGIVSLADAGTIFVINNDLVCNDVDLARYIRVMNTNIFYMEKMNRKEFCKNWIISFPKI